MVLVADEIHGDLIRKGQTHYPICTLVDDDRLISCTAINKTFNVAGLHCSNIIVNNDDEESIGVYTGKLFELIRLGKPILALGPRECIIKDLLLATHTGNYAYIQDEAEILANVNKLYQPQEFSPDLESTRAYSRPNLTAQLMKLYAKD